MDDWENRGYLNVKLNICAETMIELFITSKTTIIIAIVRSQE